MLDCEAITDVEVTAADMLERLDLELNAQGVHIAFVGLRTRLRDLLVRYRLLETLDRRHFYPSMARAIEEIDADVATPRPMRGADRPGGGPPSPPP